MNRPKEKSPDTPLKALNSEETMMTVYEKEKKFIK